jgi:hypothetical protein
MKVRRGGNEGAMKAVPGGRNLGSAGACVRAALSCVVVRVGANVERCRVFAALQCATCRVGTDLVHAVSVLQALPHHGCVMLRTRGNVGDAAACQLTAGRFHRCCSLRAPIPPNLVLAATAAATWSLPPTTYTQVATTSSNRDARVGYGTHYNHYTSLGPEVRVMEGKHKPHRSKPNHQTAGCRKGTGTASPACCTCEP